MFKKCLGNIRGKKVILCVSGGVDSMVLLHAVYKYKDEMNIFPIVCHFEHGIRGKDSINDMELVKSKCNEYGIKSIIRCENIPLLCNNGDNLEEVARNRRYSFFYECMKEHGADAIVLAHHRDDNCETVLMNIIRGCGIGGLCGMEKISKALYRPLLDFSKEQLYFYAKENGIEFHEDATNSDLSYLRNSIRHEIIPFLKNKNPRIDDAIERLREIALVENDFLEGYVKNLDWIIQKPYGYDIEVKQYTCAHEAIKRRAVLYVLRQISGRDYSYRLYNDVNSLILKGTGKKVCAFSEVTIYKEQGVLSFVKKAEAVVGEYALSAKGVSGTPFGRFIVNKSLDIDMEQVKNAPLTTAYFGLENGAELTVRSRRQGDKIHTFGKGTKKLKDVLIDKKIPVFLRDTLPVVCKNDEIVWVPGVIRSCKYPINDRDGIKIDFLNTV